MSKKMTNYVQQGDIIDLVTPSGGYTSGQLVVAGELTGVAGKTTLEDELCPVSMSGVFVLPKLAGALAVGAKVYSDAGAAVDGTDTDTFVGFVTVAALSGDATASVKLSN